MNWCHFLYQEGVYPDRVLICCKTPGQKLSERAGGLFLNPEHLNGLSTYDRDPQIHTLRFLCWLQKCQRASCTVVKNVYYHRRYLVL